MDIRISRLYLTEQDFEAHPIWKFSDEDDLNYQVCIPDDFPDDSRDLRIRAEFETTHGLKLNGYIVGVKNIFCVAIFIGNKILRFNKNLLKDCQENLKKINAITGENLTIQDFSPLKYTTTIDLENFKNISGEFNLSKKRTDAERLDH